MADFTKSVEEQARHVVEQYGLDRAETYVSAMIHRYCHTNRFKYWVNVGVLLKRVANGAELATDDTDYNKPVEEQARELVDSYGRDSAKTYVHDMALRYFSTKARYQYWFEILVRLS